MAIASGLGLAPLPYDLLLVLRQLPIVFTTHMIASGLALILIPITAFARHRRKTHRMLGRVTAACVVVGGVTALCLLFCLMFCLDARGQEASGSAPQSGGPDG